MKVLWLSILSMALCFAFAQIPEQIAQIPLPEDPDILTGVLQNGISYYIMENPKPENRAELRLFVDVGSIVEDEDQKGLAHFTEHMAFNGSTHFGRSEVVDYLASIGMGFANGLNAMTSYDFTMYQLKIPTDNQEQLEKGFLILSDMASEVSFTEQELEKERGVIIEEWRMGQGAQSRISDAISAVRFAGSRYADRAPIGTYEVLTSFTRDEIVRFYEDWYRPDLQSVIVIGDLPKEESLALLEQYFAQIPAKENPRPREVYTVPHYPEARAVVAIDPEYPYSTITASWARERKEFKDVGDYYKLLHEKLFFDMLNSRLEELSLLEDPPFSAAFGHSSSMLKGLSSTELMAYTGEGKNREALRVLLTEAERIRRHGFQASELERAKVRLTRSLESEAEKSGTRESASIVWSLFGTLLMGNANMSAQQELELAAQLLPAIQLEAVNGIVDNLITEDNLTISYTGTEKEGVEHPSEEELLSVYQEVMDTEIAPYVDSVVTQPLIAQIPTPGKIVHRQELARGGITKWQLSNNITVYSKKTDFKADEVLVSAKSVGGFSRYGIEVAKAAQQLGNYLDASGVGEFDSNDLSRILAGKLASASLNLSMFHEGLSASASPRDMEVMFQLIHQRATNPRFDDSSLTSYVNRMKPFMENMANNPEQAFFDSLSAYASDHHPMAEALKVEDLSRLSLEQLRLVHADRYADFSDFVFFVVGNFDEEQLEEYLCTYLATLPTARRKDKFVDPKIKLIKGTKEVRFQKGNSESAHVAHITNGKIKINQQNSVDLAATSLVLNEKLRENIRENMSGVYVVQASYSLSDGPDDKYNLFIYMACDPARVDELNQAIYATVDSLRNGLFDEKYVSSAKAVLQKRYEESISNNRYWLSRMQDNHFRKVELDSFLDNPDYYEGISKKDIVNTAKKYLDFDKNKISLIMTPNTAPIKEAKVLKQGD
jgi:zinc protease